MVGSDIGGGFGGRNPHLADVAAVHFDDFILVIIDFKLFALGGDVTEIPQDVTGQRRVAVAVIDEVAFDQAAEAADVDLGVHHHAAVFRPLEDRAFLAFIREVAGDGLENVRRRDHALE